MFAPATSSPVFASPREVGAMYDRNLYALRRQDPSVISVIARFGQVRCELQGSVGIFGKLVIYEREVFPTRGFAILNDSRSRDVLYIQNLYSDDDLSVDGQHIVVSSRSQPLAHRWSLFDNPHNFASFDALLDDSPAREPTSVYLLVDDDDFFALSSSLQTAIRNAAFLPNTVKTSLSRLLTPLNLGRAVTTFGSPISPLDSPGSPRFNFYNSSASPFTSPPRSMQSSPFHSNFSMTPEPTEKVLHPVIVPQHEDSDDNTTSTSCSSSVDSDSNRLALLHKVFGDSDSA